MLDKQLLAITSTAILASQHLPQTIDEWEALVPTCKTQAHWKAMYCAAHIMCKCQLWVAGGAEQLGGAHATSTLPTALTSDAFTHLDGYLNNRSFMATHKKTMLASLIDSNASLTASVASLTTSVAVLVAALSICMNMVPSGQSGPLPPLLPLTHQG